MTFTPLIGAAAAGIACSDSHCKAAQEDAKYDKIREAISDILADNDSHGPLFVRLAWHASGTYSAKDKTGGSDGATMRFKPEREDPANAGLTIAQKLLEPIKKQNPWISYADLWTLAGVLAIEEMGGPVIDWRPGRSDAKDESACPPQGRLPDGAKGQDHVRDVFYRMGFNDREIVALIGAHALGRCHRDRSGFEGPWTRAPTTFSNMYFTELLGNEWRFKKWNGPQQYEDAPTGELMMLPADMAIKKDPTFRKYAEVYAIDEDLFFEQFSKAFGKLIELGRK